METIAVYWESRIRTYGFHLCEALRMCRIDIAPEKMVQWGQALQSMADQGPVFQVVWAQGGQGGATRFFLLSDEIHWVRLNPFLDRQLAVGNVSVMGDPTRVDLLFFQGPHYGDRYGVLDFTLTPLIEAQIPILAVACSVATIYLVLRTGWGGQAKALLTNAFEIPRNVRI